MMNPEDIIKDRLKALIRNAERVLGFDKVWSEMIVNSVIRDNIFRDTDHIARIAMLRLHLPCILELCEDDFFDEEEFIKKDLSDTEYYAGPMDEEEICKLANLSQFQ
jgi:hypothetical protein